MLSQVNDANFKGVLEASLFDKYVARRRYISGLMKEKEKLFVAFAAHTAKLSKAASNVQAENNETRVLEKLQDIKRLSDEAHNTITILLYIQKQEEIEKKTIIERTSEPSEAINFESEEEKHKFSDHLWSEKKEQKKYTASQTHTQDATSTILDEKKTIAIENVLTEDAKENRPEAATANREADPTKNMADSREKAIGSVTEVNRKLEPEVHENLEKEVILQPQYVNKAMTQVKSTEDSEQTLIHKFGDPKTIIDRTIKSEEALADKFMNKGISNLVDAIGISEKFMFIHELFKGETAHYIRTLNELNNCTDLKEASAKIEKLGKNLSWDKGSPAYELLQSIIIRKYPV